MKQFPAGLDPDTCEFIELSRLQTRRNSRRSVFSSTTLCVVTLTLVAIAGYKLWHWVCYGNC